jgi:phage-related protein
VSRKIKMNKAPSNIKRVGQKTPPKEIEQAMQKMKDYLERND